MLRPIAATLLGTTLLVMPVLAAPALAQTAGGSAASPNAAPAAKSVSVDSPPKQFQPVGSFPTNVITNRPFVGPQGGVDGLRKDVAALQRTLTEMQQLQLQIKQAHWNVSGAGFYEIHDMLQHHYEGIEKLTDMVAERLLAIGSSADGRAHTIVATSKVPEIPGGFLNGADEMAWFTSVYKLVGDEVRQSVEDVNDIDPTTGNLLQSVEDAVDKYQWQTRAFLQATPTNANTGADFNGGKAVDLPSQTPPDVPGPGK